VDAAYLLYVEGAVAEPLPGEDDEAVEHAVDGAVVDARGARFGARVRIDDGRRPFGKATFEERVRVRIEEAPATRREVEVLVLHAEEDGAEQREELAVGAEAVVHALGVRAGVGFEALVEAGHAEVLGVDGVLDRQEALVLGVEEEDEA